MMPAMMGRFAALLLTAAIGASVAAEPAPARTRAIALVGGTLIDGNGGPPLRNSVVLIQGERIAAIGQAGELAIPEDAEVVSTEGMSVLPGLWDMHVHLMINGHADYATGTGRMYRTRCSRPGGPSLGLNDGNVARCLTSARHASARKDAILRVVAPNAWDHC
jgi:hypothetical protein